MMLWKAHTNVDVFNYLSIKENGVHSESRTDRDYLAQSHFKASRKLNIERGRQRDPVPGCGWSGTAGKGASPYPERLSE